MATLTDVDAESIRQRLVVKESLTQAFKELRAAEASGAKLPDARKLDVYKRQVYSYTFPIPGWYTSRG